MPNNFYDNFNLNGYAKWPNLINRKTLEMARNDFQRILNSLNKINYKYIRVYDDYSKRINISGIEMIFDKDLLSQNIINIIEESKIVEIAKKILKDEDLVIILSRYHVTNNYTHLGIWHRDGEPNKLDSIQLNIYLYDEKGMEIIPGTHLRENNQKEINSLKVSPFVNLINQHSIECAAGEVLAFHPSLLHRGKTLKDRAHLHFRFVSKKKLKEVNHEKPNIEYLEKYKLSNGLLDILKKSICYENRKTAQEYFYPNNSNKYKIILLIRYILHNVIFFLPYESKLYSFFNVRPCLKKRFLFGLL